MDALNRTTGLLYRDGTRVTYTFDQAGQQTTIQDLTGVRTYTYDNDARETSVAYPTGKTLTYAFDSVSNRIGLLDPDGGRTTYAYDAQDRLTSIVNPFAETTTLTYDPLDRELQKTLGNGMAVSHTYDAAGRETLLENRKVDGTALAVFTATYDSVGNRLTVFELDGTRFTFAYDPAYQLTNEQRSGANAYNTTYSYDPVQNRLVKNDSGQLTTYTYNAGSELTLLTPPTGQPTTVTWDGNGNKAVENAGGSLTTYTWDSENQLLGVAYPDSTIETYTYSADGLRQKSEIPMRSGKATATGTTIYVRDGESQIPTRSGNVLIETNANLITQVQYTDFPGIWGGLSSERQSGVSSFYVMDSQENTRILVSPGGVITDSYTYKAFGEELAVSGTTVNLFRFGGQVGYYRDIASRLYVRARHLDVVTGRWLTQDRFDSTPGVNPNRYVYARNNSLIAVDPLGLFVRVGGIPDCVKNTSDYANRYKQKGNLFDKCAAEVSGALCAYVISCQTRPLAPDCLLVAPGLQCLNTCMARHWRARDTQRWKKADDTCRHDGVCSKSCCEASVTAEQDALSKCTAGCGLVGDIFRRWPQASRIDFALQTVKCCEGAKKPSVPVI